MNSSNQPEAVQMDQVEVEEPLRIMLLGKCGAGKSSSGNTLLNKTVFTALMKMGRVTPYCEKEEGLVDDTPIAVIDTPGFFETDSNKREIVREILKCVKLLEPGPHVFVFVVKLGRMTQEDQATMSLIESKFGPRVWDYTIVLFTHGDTLEGKTINDAITECDDTLRNFIRKCSGGFHVFNNKNPEDQTQVTTFMEKIQTLIALNGGGHYQTKLYPEEEQEIREKQERILAERNEEISAKERNLKENLEGDELQKEIRKLWRKEEEKSRQMAEKPINNIIKIIKNLYYTKIVTVPFWQVLVVLVGVVYALYLMLGAARAVPSTEQHVKKE